MEVIIVLRSKVDDPSTICGVTVTTGLYRNPADPKEIVFVIESFSKTCASFEVFASFERFIDINRMDLPDIDIDFEDIRRPKVKKYLEEKYGEDRVANLPTFAIFQGKSALGGKKLVQTVKK
jgi:hypothetical protein